VSSASAPDTASDGQAAGGPEDYLRPFLYALLIKYGVLGVGAMIRLGKAAADHGFGSALSARDAIFWPTRFSSVIVALLILRWIRRRSLANGIAAMSAVFLEGLVRIVDQGPYFFNHYLVQVLLGVMGAMAVARQIEGERSRAAWNPVALLGVLVWGLAGLKKLLHGSYVSGEYLASAVDQANHSLMWRLMRVVLVEGGESSVSVHCCYGGPVRISVAMGLFVSAIGVAMAMAEISPVVVLAVTRNRASAGWLMLVLSIVATGITNEMDFGMLLVAFALLVGEGRRFRSFSYLTILGLAGGYLWSVVR
jgi:hypothetical protein